jgi:hypothetical protein
MESYLLVNVPDLKRFNYFQQSLYFSAQLFYGPFLHAILFRKSDLGRGIPHFSRKIEKQNKLLGTHGELIPSERIHCIQVQTLRLL